MEQVTSAVLEYRYYIEILAIALACVTALSSVDDVFVDVYYWCLRLFGNQSEKDRQLSVALAAEVDSPERPLAIMVPAWHEHDVIYSMVATNSRLLAYHNYHYFIGVYQNDIATIAEVLRAQAEFANVHMSVLPRNGPTSKADCLNVILSEILAYEAKMGGPFAGIALHDAEDFIHPQELAVFNQLIGTQFDFVQLPVFSFSQPLRDMVGGIYMDEFAEVHTKDLLVRRHLSGLIPCAGVSACFSRDAIVALAQNNMGAVFQISSFTEDYDIAFRLRALGLRTTFVSCPVNYTIDINRETVAPAIVKRTLPIATREFFPSKMRDAYRQRARWLIGIVFQGTSSHGWSGNWGTKYFLARDRKGILTGPTVVFGYFALVNLLLIALYLWIFEPDSQFDFVLLWQDYTIDLFFVNFIFLVWRIGHRMYFTTTVYDIQHGLMSAPRLIVANYVNFRAAVRATSVYLAHIIVGKPLVWDKTAHSYPIQFQRDAGPAGESHRVVGALALELKR
ncbi:MAG: glycosyl transferase family protein [Tardiphaga sp.]